jgi:transposase
MTKLNEDQIKHVKTSYYAGVKPSKLAEELGVHLSTIYRQLDGVKLKFKKVTLVEAREIYQLANDGVSLRRLAKLYNISYETVRRIKGGL